MMRLHLAKYFLLERLAEPDANPWNAGLKAAKLNVGKARGGESINEHK